MAENVRLGLTSGPSGLFKSSSELYDPHSIDYFIPDSICKRGFELWPDITESDGYMFYSSFFVPLYEIFICYGHEDFNDKNEDEGSINTSLAFEKLSKETENAYT